LYPLTEDTVTIDALLLTLFFLTNKAINFAVWVKLMATTSSKNFSLKSFIRLGL
jgi:hypothetical protein